jgi:hypothetical protein
MMFGKEAPGLRNLSLSSRVAVTGFLALAGIGYLFGYFNILLTYQMTDGQTGLSPADVKMVYHGSSNTALQRSIDGSMRQYFSSENNYNVVNDWILLGAGEATYGPVQQVFNLDCVSCHNSQTYAAANLVLEDFGDVEPYLRQDGGKSISRLVSLSHTHLLSTSVVVFVLVFIFSFSSYPVWLKLALPALAFLAIFLDIGSWWLTKFSPGFAILVIAGGALLGTSFGALSVLGLWDTWLGKKIE